MAEIIQDGTGESHKAKINSKNRLLVLAVTHTEEHIESLIDASAYFSNTADTDDLLTIPNGFDGPVLCISNNSSTTDLVVQKLVASADAAGLIMRVIRNHTVGTVSNNNVHIPVNSNFGSAKAADVTAYNWDEVGTTGIGGLTNGSKWKTFSLKSGPEFFPIDGTIVLAKNATVSIDVVNNTGAAVEFECGIRFYEDSSRED